MTFGGIRIIESVDTRCESVYKGRGVTCRCGLPKGHTQNHFADLPDTSVQWTDESLNAKRQAPEERPDLIALENFHHDLRLSYKYMATAHDIALLDRVLSALRSHDAIRLELIALRNHIAEDFAEPDRPVEFPAMSAGDLAARVVGELTRIVTMFAKVT